MLSSASVRNLVMSKTLDLVQTISSRQLELESMMKIMKVFYKGDKSLLLVQKSIIKGAKKDEKNNNNKKQHIYDIDDNKYMIFDKFYSFAQGNKHPVFLT